MAIDVKCVLNTIIYGPQICAADENGVKLPITADRLCENEVFADYSTGDVEAVLDMLRSFPD